MIILRMILILPLIWTATTGCGGSPEYYPNPYGNPRSQMEYGQWTSEIQEIKARSDKFIRNGNFEMGTYEQQAPIFQGYIEDVDQVNQRLQSLRAREDEIRSLNFEEIMGRFSALQGKIHGAKDKESGLFIEKQASEKARYDEYVRQLDEKRKLALP